MKRIYKIGATLVAATFALTACGGGGSNTTEASNEDPANLETTIKILAPSYSESSKSDWQAIITEFNKTYPKVKVELQIEGWDDFTSKVQARIQAKDYPDILNDNAFAAAGDGGLLYPMNEVLDKKTLDSIEPALLANGKGKDGTQWAAPDVASSRMLAYNTTLFEKAGIKDAPKTWADLESDAMKVSKLGNSIYGYGMPLGREEAQVESSLWLWGAGGSWVDGENLVANSPKAVEAYTEMKKLIDAKAVQPNPGSTNRQQAVDLWNNGKLGMLLMHTGLLATTDKDFPNVKYKLAPVPSKDGKAVAFGVTDFLVAFNNEDAKRKQATSAFLNLFYSDAVYSKWYKPTGLMPVTTTQITAASKDAGHFAPFYDALKVVKFEPVGNPQWDTLKDALQGGAGKLESQDPKTVLDAIQQQVDAQR